jgi:transcriptional regulator with XRE-family HTH domain
MATTQLSVLIGKNLSQFRRERGITQADLAERIDVDAETISRFERGTVTPSVATLERLCGALDCRWSDLLEGVSAASQQLGPEIARLLDPLSPKDRLFILDQVKVWSDKLATKTRRA